MSWNDSLPNGQRVQIDPEKNSPDGLTGEWNSDYAGEYGVVQNAHVNQYRIKLDSGVEVWEWNYNCLYH